MQLGRFKPGEREGFILKQMDDLERLCLVDLKKDILSPFVPKIGQILQDTEDKNCNKHMISIFLVETFEIQIALVLN